MNVSIEQSVLADALNFVGAAVSKRAPKWVLRCVLISAHDGKAGLSGTQLDITAARTIQAAVNRSGKALLPLDIVAGIVRECRGETINIKTDDDGMLEILAGDAKFRINTADPAEFPATPEPEGKTHIKVDASKLFAALDHAIPATARESSHYAISGILIESDGNDINIVGTDGRRMSVSTIKPQAKTHDEFAAVVPADAMQMLRRIKAHEDASAYLKFNHDRVSMLIGGSTVVSSLVAGSFPKWRDVVPDETTDLATIEAGILRHAVRQAAKLTNEESRHIKLTIQQGQAVISSSSPDSGEAWISCEADYDGDAIEIGLDPAFVLDAIAAAGDSDIVDIMFNDATTPILLQSQDDARTVIMPVKLE